LVPVGSADSGTIDATVGAINPKGKTPITAALRRAADELHSAEQKATVIVISDGLETCNADPCATATELEASGVDFTVHVVSFGATDEETRQLQCIADNTGGRLLAPSSASDVLVAMAEPKIEEPKTAAPEIKPNVGMMSLTNTEGPAKIFDRSGMFVDSTCGGCATRLLPVGIYSITGVGFETSNVEVRPGETTLVNPGAEAKARVKIAVDPGPTVGFMSLTNTRGPAKIFDRSGMLVDSMCGGCGSRLLPVGTYSVTGVGFEIAGVEVKPGEETMIDAGG
jgi:hypothetical protein